MTCNEVFVAQETIGARAFYDSFYYSPTSVTIPDSVITIGAYAFQYYPNLTNITFEGTTEQWNDIRLDSYWNYNILATEVACSNGTVISN